MMANLNGSDEACSGLWLHEQLCDMMKALVCTWCAMGMSCTSYYYSMLSGWQSGLFLEVGILNMT